MSAAGRLRVETRDEDGNAGQRVTLWCEYDAGGDVFVLLAELPFRYWEQAKACAADVGYKRHEHANRYWAIKDTIDHGSILAQPAGTPAPSFTDVLGYISQYRLIPCSIGQIAARICAGELDRWEPMAKMVSSPESLFAFADGDDARAEEEPDWIVQLWPAEDERFTAIRVWETGVRYAREITDEVLNRKLKQFNAALPKQYQVQYRKCLCADGIFGIEFDFEPVVVAIAMNELRGKVAKDLA